MKPYRLLPIIVLILFCIEVFLNLPTKTRRLPVIETDTESLQKAFPAATTFRKAKTDLPLYEALDPKQTILGYAFYTLDLAPDISGYSGPINMAVGIDRQGTIIGAYLVSQQETPGFSAKISDLIERAIGITAQSPLELGKNIDGISGATITSTAVISAINTARQKILPALGKNTPQAKMAGELKNNSILALCLMLFLFGLAGLTCTTRRTIFRWTALSAGFIILGLILKKMLSASHIAGIALSQNPTWPQDPLLHLLLLGALASGIFLGRAYCSGLCPFAFVEEALYGINKRFLKLSFSPDEKTDCGCRWIKYIFLLGVLAACFYLKQSGAGAVEVYITLFSGKGFFAGWLLLAIVLCASFFFLRFWCKYLCPCGAFLAMIAQMRLYDRSQTPPSPSNMCADAAECFYCDHCSRADFSKSTKRQKIFFLFMIVLSVTALLFSFSQVIVSMKQQEPPAQKTIAPVITQAYSDSENAKKKLTEAGIVLHPAKYWKALNNE